MADVILAIHDKGGSYKSEGSLNTGL